MTDGDTDTDTEYDDGDAPDASNDCKRVEEHFDGVNAVKLTDRGQADGR